MFRFTLLIAVSVATATLADDVSKDDFMKSCGKLIANKAGRCCKFEMPSATMAEDESLKECAQLPGGPASCDRLNCIANKRGVASADGTINKAKLTEAIQKDFGSFPKEVLASVKEKCIDTDLQIYGNPDECTMMKFLKCGHLIALANCQDMDNSGPCEGAKDAAAECKKLINV